VRGVPAELAFERLVRDPRAWELFAERGLPTTRDEDWRFTSLAPLESVEFAAPEPLAVPPAELARLRARVGDARLSAAPLDEPLGAVLDFKRSPFAALNAALADGGESIDAASNCDQSLPFHLIRWLPGGAARVTSPRARIVVRAGASATVVEHFAGASGSKSLSNSATELVLEPGARLRYVQLQELPDSAFHVGSLASRQAAGSRLELSSIVLGARLSRTEIHATLAGEGAELELDGLYLGRGVQVLDHHTTIDHAMPRTTSRELFKGILDGRAHGVFHGRVHVRPHAQKIDAAQTNRALLLSDGAVVDSKPQLEIYADDVKCSHGASVGQLDPDQLFYLRARGLDLPAARSLLTFGFASEVLDKLPLPALRESLAHAALSWLGGTP
jgi:Fe-S cluster assembly protein SufD